MTEVMIKVSLAGIFGVSLGAALFLGQALTKLDHMSTRIDEVREDIKTIKQDMLDIKVFMKDTDRRLTKLESK